jgi:serine/threonine-protein kinase RsbT
MPISVLNKAEMLIDKDQDVVPFRNRLKVYAMKTGMGIVDQTKLITAASELARNMLKYASGGIILMEELNKGTDSGVRVTFQDNGPGIDNVQLALRDGYSTGNSLGLGLPGAQRLVSEFAIQSQVGKGTTITIIKWKNG